MTNNTFSAPKPMCYESYRRSQVMDGTDVTGLFIGSLLQGMVTRTNMLITAEEKPRGSRWSCPSPSHLVH